MSAPAKKPTSYSHVDHPHAHRFTVPIECAAIEPGGDPAHVWRSSTVQYAHRLRVTVLRCETCPETEDVPWPT